MVRSTSPADVVSVPPRYPTSLIFLDESGSKSTANTFFVVGALKLRAPGLFARELQDLRDRHSFNGEFKFSEITRGTLSVYFDLIDRLHDSDAHLAACVVDTKTNNPFAGKAAWEGHADVTTQLLVGCINRRELVGVLMDGISTPRGCSLADTVRDNVNRRLKATSVISAACLNSETNDVLQVADLVAGAIAFERRRAQGRSGKPNSNKGKVAARLGVAFDALGFANGRATRVNIASYRGGRPKLHVVGKTRRTG